jgi:HemY protein
MHLLAEKEIATTLKHNWLPTLVRLYGKVDGKDVTKQLKKAEGWLATRGEDVDLLLTTAQLCLRNELWGKARSYFETVIAIRPTPDAYRDYGRLLNQLGENEAAADAYKEGLSLVPDPQLPGLPHLAPDPE